MASLWTKFNDIKQINMINVPDGLSPKQVKVKYPDADIISSLAMFVLSNGLNFVRFEDENVKGGYLGASEGIGIIGKKELVWCTYLDAYNSIEIRDFCAGFPAIVKDGKENIDWGNKYSSYTDGTHKRLLIGFNNDYMVICATDYKITLKSAARVMIGFGCKYAINCDGGEWSPHLQIGNKIIRQGYRKNPTWLLIYLDKRQLFAEYVKSKKGCDYIWAANGEIFTLAKLKSYINWFGIKHYISSKFNATKNAMNDIPDFDCSGLMVAGMREYNIISEKADYTAEKLLKYKCYEIAKNILQNGDLLFRGNPAYHVGMYYNGEVIHAKGTAHGVVQEDVVDTFTRFGRLKGL